jgi:DNA polymerase-3 subunit delta'
VFRDVVGHQRLVSLLARSIRQDSLPPSLIFAGPAGVGKRLVALAAAQALNCPNRTEAEPGHGAAEPRFIDACGVCPVCARIARGIHPDVLFVEPGENGSIKIEQVREIVERVGYRPFEGRRRVVIIDEADSLVPQAQNALLKTLEEPPSCSVFILVTSRPDTLLPTVRSRCPVLRFRALDADEVARALVKQGRSQSEARAVAATADGSVGHALDASAGDLVEAREAAALVLAQAAAGADRLEAARNLVSKTSGKGSEDRERLATKLRAMSSLLRDVEVLSAGGPGEPALDRLNAFRGERGVRAFAAVDRALWALERNAGAKIVADWVVFQL